MHSMQSLIAALLVSGCALYAIWALMPASARRGAALVLLRLPLPALLCDRLRQIAQATTGCGCTGCDRAEKKPGAQPQSSGTTHTITFHRAPRR